VDLLLENRKIRAQLLRIQRRLSRDGHVAIVSPRVATRLIPRIALAAALATLLAGCGGSATRSNSGGAKVFASAGCGGCHTLSAAKSKGQQGPNLDQLKPGYDVVVRQVANGGGGMPSFAGRLSKKQIQQVASYVSSSARNSSASLTAFHPNDEKVAKCGPDDYACFKQSFGNLAYYSGPKEALARLAQYMESNDSVRSGCHQIAHEIGHAGYVRYHGNAAQALANGSMTCWSGYYHGVIERAFGGVPRAKVASIARSLCSGNEVRKTYFLAYQCVHGLGHGLMIYSLNDLPYSLHVCDELATQWDQVSCTGGVFMQNFLPGPMQLTPTKWLKKSDLIYPCNVVKQKDKLYCYLMITSRILPAVNYDFRKTASWCWRAEKAWIATCFQSFGRDASGNSVQNPRKIVQLCHLAGSMERECIYGGSRDLTSNDAGPRRAIEMCQLAPAATRSYCFYGIGTILGGFSNDSAGRRARCNPVPAAYRRDCYRGANV
jgi:mono/diheme cytochrome c family protein